MKSCTVHHDHKVLNNRVSLSLLESMKQILIRILAVPLYYCFSVMQCGVYRNTILDRNPTGGQTMVRWGPVVWCSISMYHSVFLRVKMCPKKVLFVNLSQYLAIIFDPHVHCYWLWSVRCITTGGSMPICSHNIEITTCREMQPQPFDWNTNI